MGLVSTGGTLLAAGTEVVKTVATLGNSALNLGNTLLKSRVVKTAAMFGGGMLIADAISKFAKGDISIPKNIAEKISGQNSNENTVDNISSNKFDNFLGAIGTTLSNVTAKGASLLSGFVSRAKEATQNAYDMLGIGSVSEHDREDTVNTYKEIQQQGEAVQATAAEKENEPNDFELQTV